MVGPAQDELREPYAGEIVGYSTQPVELFGVAPVGSLIQDLFPVDAEKGIAWSCQPWTCMVTDATRSTGTRRAGFDVVGTMPRSGRSHGLEAAPW